MGAYYHALVPYKISIQDKLDLKTLFNKQFGVDFVFQKEEKIERFSPPFSDGTRLDWSYVEKHYVLPEEIIREEFLEFSQILYDEWRKLYQSKFKDKIPFSLPKQDDLALLLLTIKKAIDQHPLDSKNLKNALNDIEDNYSVTIEGISPQFVYNGYPLETDHHTSLMALDFLHSYEKMNVYPDEYAALYMLVDRMQDKYGQSLKMAKYLFLAGY